MQLQCRCSRTQAKSILAVTWEVSTREREARLTPSERYAEQAIREKVMRSLGKTPHPT